MLERFFRRFRYRNPDAQLNRLILEMQKQVLDTRRVVASAVAEAKHLQHSITDQQTQISRCDQRAADALRAGSEDRARHELDLKQRELEYQHLLKQDLARREIALTALRDNLRGLQDHLNEAQRKRELLAARMRDPGTRARVMELIEEIGDIHSFERLDAVEDLSREIPDRDPDAEIAALTGPSREEMLQELKIRIRKETRDKDST